MHPSAELNGAKRARNEEKKKTLSARERERRRDVSSTARGYGFEHRWSKDLSLGLAAAYVPEGTLSGPGSTSPAHTIELDMHQWEATFGVKYLFGEPPVALK